MDAVTAAPRRTSKRRGRIGRTPTLFLLGREDQPLRAEFLSLDQLERHGRALANWHQVARKPRPDRLLARLAENAAVLREAYEVVNTAVAAGRAVVPAAEWLLDNFYVVETHIRTARQHLPRHYSQELPQLAGGPADGMPRVYDIAMELISHADGLLDAENLRQFVAAYQSVTPLKLGELWAIPIMLRLALLENLRRIAARIAWQQRDRDLGSSAAETVLGILDRDPKNLIVALAELIKSDPPLSSSFVAEYAQRLQGRVGQTPLAVNWMEHRLAEQGQSIEQLVRLSSQSQAADQVSIGNSITSLRSLGALDWRGFVEEQSRVERVLRSDPSEAHTRMSFATRDRYRHAVEQIAKRSPRSEEHVARVAVELAQDAHKTHPDPGEEFRGRDREPDNHVGYYLVDAGRDLLEKSVGYRPSVGDRLGRAAARFRFGTFVGAIVLVWGVTLGLIAAAAHGLGLFAMAPTAAWLVPFLLLAVGLSQFAVAIVNWLCTLVVPPRPVYRLDFSQEIPIDCRTIVVVPTMLTSLKGVASLLEQLEVRYLANRDRNLHFALLTDFADAEEPARPGDDQLVEAAKQGVETLNRKYADDRSGVFYLFHRPRQYNEQEGVWMGRERKRGKLADFNALLRGGRADAFSVIVGNLLPLSAVRYVITLDTDTQLPRDSAHQLVGCMAHPLNRPRFDSSRGCVARGYAILQPRVAVTVPEGNRSLYSRLFAGDPGIDPYTNQVSDVYQDVFGDGSFIGKGIYDLDAFESALHERFPDNRILSHDLVESCYARSGLVSDIELFEGFPSRYLADASRRHRWVRGDWQLLPWVLRKVPGPRGAVRNPLSMLGRWKLFDNLRRSFVPPALLLLLAAAWILTPAWGWFWTAVVLALTFLPGILAAVPGVFRVPEEMPVGLHLKGRARDFGRQLAQGTFSLAVLPYEAHWNVDAVVRTLYRVFVSRKRMLEWTTASDAERRAAGNLRDHYELMFASTVVSLGLAAALAVVARPALPAAAPLLALWLAGPWLAWRISQPLESRRGAVGAEQRATLRRYARRTWHYFETFVTERDHWLAPDNYQEHPTGVVAARTSPTNMGMGLIANLAAWDFGYLSAGRMADRLGRTLDVMDRMERLRGHFYNWYDTRTLQPIEPRYVSSVDSGNLAGLLLTLKAGLEHVGREPLVRRGALDGLADTLRVALEVARRGGGQGAVVRKPLPREVVARIERLVAECGAPAESLTRAHQMLEHLAVAGADLAASVPVAADIEVGAWVRAFEAQCRELDGELLRLAPWVAASIPAAGEEADAPPEPVARVRQLVESLDRGCSLEELPRRAGEVRAAIEGLSPLPPVPSRNGSGGHDGAGGRATLPAESWGAWSRYAALFDDGAREASLLSQSLHALAQRCGELAVMDFRFLYDARRDLLTIGYNATDRRTDPSFYDLLASEARLASFVAISQGQLPREHWFALGRMMTTQDGAPTLLSWSGSMFEYLMPALVMPNYEGTLLDQACRGAVRRQIAYGRQRHVPWGVSESCYNVTDLNLTYQYRAFGVPGLGLQRGLGEDLVIAPYASVMAAMVEPDAACRNLEQLESAGYLGEYGFYDAIDYTPSRRGPSDEPVPCRTYMAHHSGMSFLALAHVLLDRPMQRRFLADPLLKAHDLLLQERVPHAIRPVDPHPAESRDPHAADGASAEATTRFLDTADTPVPEIQLLGNGRYHVMVSNAGGGYSRWNDLAVTRWQPDATRDDAGQFCYVRDLRSGEFWSTTVQPTLHRPEKYHAHFSHARAEFRCVSHGLDMQTTVGVSPEDDLEVRRIILKNIGRLPRSIELTSYGEVVLAPPAADAAHRAFSNLFVETELIPDRCAILCTRRPRTPEERPPYLFHLMVFQEPRKGHVSYETDRARFIGRGRSLAEPACMDAAGDLSGTAGAVLDPIVSVRRDVQIPAEQSFRVDVITGVAPTRELGLALIEKYQDHRLADRVFELAWTHGQVALKQLGASEADVQTYSRLAGPLVYGGALYRANPALLSQNRRNQSHLWAYGISGDLPIVLVKLTDLSRLSLVRRVLQAHAYWRLKGLQADLVIWNDDFSGYRHQMHDALMGLVSSGPDAPLLDRPGGIFIRRSDQMPEEDRRLLEGVAAVVLSDALGSLNEQLDRRPRGEVGLPALRVNRPRKGEPERDASPPRRELVFFNGFGGFTADSKEYVMLLRPGVATPAPWCNVLANDRFGTVVSESGLGYTWFRNAHEFRLTPWHNDPVCDAAGEALYVRDEETGRHFSPTPLPARGGRPYVCRHGFGYSVWEYEEAGLQTELTAFVAVDAPVKFLLLKIRNASGRKRTLSVTGYVEWVLGELRPKSAPHVVTEIDPQTGGLFARNCYSLDFNGAVAFFHASEVVRSVTCDRGEFLGRNGTLAEPAAMRQVRLSGRAGAGLDPCCAIQTWMELGDSEEHEVVFVLGAADSAAEASGLLQRFKGIGDARRTLEKVWGFWTHALSAVYVETPDLRLNALANGWLLYQTLACRFWGRSGYYQSGGAYGFRDQLQDSLALLYSAGHLTREHLLRCAARQFREGDVQHWWHPPTGRGVRTHFSDDYLWLPFAAAQYVHVTGDTGILNETVGFLTDRPVAPDEEGFYSLPQPAEESAPLYEHCKRAIRRGLRFGRHGLPLMGCGDWNDGMNRVGAEGQGESVWLAFFLYDILRRFAPLAERRGDAEFAATCVTAAERLRETVEEEGWDGGWYRRAYFDDGRPLGSRENAECRIDSLPQSWAVISGAADPDRMRLAMGAVGEQLVSGEERLIRLFTPPFDGGHLEPGYIKGYVPGVRENGGQYTHAAVWTVMAYALLGENARAWECFDLINPLNHASNEADAAVYKVEPYVVAADVYAAPQHVGRGGWTWYTGSAGWMYRLIVETLFGLRLEGGTRLSFRPCVPPSWKRYKINYRFHRTFYRIHFTIAGEPTHNVARVAVDGVTLPEPVIALADDGGEHHVEVVLGLE